MNYANAIPAIDLSEAQTFDPRVAARETDKSFYKAFRNVVERIKQVRKHQVTRAAVSFGKDSKVLLNAALLAHRELVKEKAIEPSSPLIVTNIDTGVDDVFVRGQVQYEVRNLKAYCKKFNVNLIYQTAKPPTRYSWPVMYCSGLKLPSFVKSSADCSVVLKIDPAKRLERQLYDAYGEDIITLLGSRLDESTRRAKSIERHSSVPNTLTEVEAGNRTVRSFAPMAELSDEQVFGILRRMGTHPIVKTEYPIECYTPHNKLILKLYGDAQESCPVASFNDVTVEKRGSCGKSRFGCYLCLKVKDDASANARSGSAQYAAARNVLAIRDWLAHHADDMSIRESLAKSVCPVTGAIVVQKNVFNASTLEKLIYWLCQATRDDRIRAANFCELIRQKRVIEDPGYREIANDPSLSESDREFFLSHYIELHQQHMIKAIDIEQIMMICAIHARDGVKLAPYHALWIYNEVEAGRYIPYPTIEGEARTDKVPEPRFVFASVPNVVKLHLGDILMNSELSCPGSDSEQQPSMQEITLLKYVSNKQRAIKSRQAFTRRKIIKKKVSKGSVCSVKKGRMSVSLAPVEELSTLARKHERTLTLSVPGKSKVSDQIALLNIAAAREEEAIGGMVINDAESLFWFLEMEGDRIMHSHNEFVARHGSYSFGGINPLQKMLGFGVLQLTSQSMMATDALLARTDMYHQAGLLELDESSLLSKSVSQTEYRERKSMVLKQIRRRKQSDRQRIRDSLNLKAQDPVRYLCDDIYPQLPPILRKIEMTIREMVMLTLIHSDGQLRYFDGKHLSPEPTLKIIQQYDSIFGEVGKLLYRIQMDDADTVLRKHAFVIVKEYQNTKKRALERAILRIDNLNKDPSSAESVTEMLVAMYGLKMDNECRHRCLDSAEIKMNTAFSQTYKRKESRMITRLSLLKEAKVLS